MLCACHGAGPNWTKAMDALIFLIPLAVGLGLLGLLGFLWSLKSGQFDDLDGAAHRILFDDDDVTPPSRGGGVTPSRQDDGK
jgi:cbb3-type cytochrome oxidase maturation protein